MKVIKLLIVSYLIIGCKTDAPTGFYDKDELEKLNNYIKSFYRDIPKSKAVCIFSCGKGSEQYSFGSFVRPEIYKGSFTYLSDCKRDEDKNLVKELRNSFYINNERFPVLRPYAKVIIIFIGEDFKYELTISINAIRFMISKDNHVFGGTIKEEQRESILKAISDIPNNQKTKTAEP